MAPLEDPALGRLLEGFERLFQTGELSDLTVYSTDRKYAVHGAVICPRSAFFWTACTGNFKERTSREINLLDDDPNAVHCLMRYFYTLAYPEEVEIHQAVPPTLTVEGTSCTGSTGDPVGHDDSLVGETGRNLAEMSKEKVGTDSGHQQSSAEDSRVMSLGRLHQDLLVYALGEKYGVPDLKAKAAQHFNKEIQHIEMTMDIFDIVRDVCVLTPSKDRGLRDIVVGKVYSEIQYWVKEAQFMESLTGEGEFCADLLNHTVKEHLKSYESVLSTIEHPGYCNECHATMTVKRWVSKRRNVNVKKYCANCNPWG